MSAVEAHVNQARQVETTTNASRVVPRFVAIIVPLALYLATFYAHRFLLTDTQLIIAWMPSGVMAAGLLFARRRDVLPVAIGGVACAAFSIWAWFGPTGIDLAVAVTSLSVGWLVPGLILRRLGDPRAFLDRPQGLVRVLLASMAGGVAAVAVGASLKPLSQFVLEPLRETYELWGMTISLGTFLPVALAVSWARGVPRERRRWMQIALSPLTAIMLVLPVWIFPDDSDSTTVSLLSIAALALLVWIAVSVGRRATVLVMAGFLALNEYFVQRGVRTAAQRDLSEIQIISVGQVTYFVLTVGLLLVAIILRERRVSAMEVADQAAQMQVIRDAVMDAIVTIDYDHKIMSANRASVDLLGTGAHEGGSLLECLAPESANWVRSALRPDVEPEDDRSMLGRLVELVVLRGDERITTEASMVGHEVKGQRVVTLVLRDVTERKHAEDELRRFAGELERSNHDLAEFAYVASHDLQEPLRMVSFYVRLLADRYQGQLDTDADEYIHFASDGAERMQALVHDLLTYSRAGTTVVDATVVSAQDAVQDAIALLRGAIDRSGASVVADGLPEVLANRVLLVQVFQNLLGNALKFTEVEQPQIRVWSERWGDAWCITVEDNGIGIPEEQRDRIFQPFRRLSSRQKFEGNGIGLAVCKKIIDRHGGRIWVEAAPEGGSLFRFTIPGALRKIA